MGQVVLSIETLTEFLLYRESARPAQETPTMIRQPMEWDSRGNTN
jgi:hypothetical protein